MSDKQIIADDLLVAIQIYSNQPSWFGKLVKEFEGKISKNDISHHLDTLFDWGIIYGEYGYTTGGNVGRLFKITTFAEPIIKELIDSGVIE